MTTAGRRRGRAGRAAASALTILAVVFSATGRVSAADPVVSLAPGSARVRIVSSSLTEALDALARAAGFQVKYEGARPTAMLFNLEIETAGVPQAVLRLLEGQNVNYGLALDASGQRVSSLLIGTPAAKVATPSAPPAATPGGGPRPMPFATPRIPRGAPIVENNETPDEPAVEEESTPTPTPTPAPVPTPFGMRPGQPFPPGTRPPFGIPFGPRPTPSVSPLP